MIPPFLPTSGEENVPVGIQVKTLIPILSPVLFFLPVHTRLLLLCLIGLSACTPGIHTTTVPPLQVESTFAAQPWLAAVQKCALPMDVEASLVPAADLSVGSAEMSMRIGQPVQSNFPSYQIGQEEVQIIVSAASPLTSLTPQQATDLFSGRLQDWQSLDGTSGSIQLWVFPSGEDVESILTVALLDGSPVSSSARLATSPQEMLQEVAGDPDAVGVLTHSWISNLVRVVDTVATVPVIVTLPGKPQGALETILLCLQR
jgi:hypothetical protein